MNNKRTSKQGITNPATRKQDNKQTGHQESSKWNAEEQDTGHIEKREMDCGSPRSRNPSTGIQISPDRARACSSVFLRREHCTIRTVPFYSRHSTCDVIPVALQKPFPQKY